MINTFTNSAHPVRSKAWRSALVCSLLLVLAGCGKDSDDGNVVNTLALPTDNVLNLYCADFGLFSNRCVLDDPDNPYATVAFTQENKFALANAPGLSPKAKVYLWASALARFSSGENQWYTARALHELFTASGSDLIKNQTIRAYRSVLDNYFDSVTFFEATFLPNPPPGGIFYPAKLRELTAADMALTPVPFTPLFDPADTGNNDFIARQTLGAWGYTWAGQVNTPGGPVSGPVTRN